MRYSRFVRPLTISALAISTVAIRLHADDPLVALNTIIQDRFNDLERGFGYTRLIGPNTPHRFTPESVAEDEAVQRVRDAGLRVALYLAGRRVLKQEATLLVDGTPAWDRRIIVGPAAITVTAGDARLPPARDLIEESRIAFQFLEQRERYDFEVGAWRFTARAVRANATCISCHRGRKINDPLGVVIYAHQSAPK